MSLFVTLEGIDKSGKTTQIPLIESRLRDLGYSVVVIREPGSTQFSESVRSIIKNGNSPSSSLAQYLLFSSARAQLVVETIRPVKNKQTGLNIILCDRYIDSSWVYNGRNIPDSVKSMIDKEATFGISPDLTFVLDISYDEYLKRLKKGSADSMEPSNREEYRTLQNEYYRIYQNNPNRVVWVNADNVTHTEITSKVLLEIGLKLKERRLETEQLTTYLKNPN